MLKNAPECSNCAWDRRRLRRRLSVEEAGAEASVHGECTVVTVITTFRLNDQVAQVGEEEVALGEEDTIHNNNNIINNNSQSIRWGVVGQEPVEGSVERVVHFQEPLVTAVAEEKVFIHPIEIESTLEEEEVTATLRVWSVSLVGRVPYRPNRNDRLLLTSNGPGEASYFLSSSSFFSLTLDIKGLVVS